MEENAIDDLCLGYMFLDDVDYVVVVDPLLPLPERRYKLTQ
jgi:hypothetical protein